MNIYAIGDLHLSGQPEKKPMHIFSSIWQDHWQKIKNSWLNKVTYKDLVLICGDTSWAMKISDAKEDIESIASLPGKKIFIRGNHDYWWSTIGKMQKTFDSSCFFIHNNFYAADDIAICGSRGWLNPNDEEFSPDDEKIYQTELVRIEKSLDDAKNAGFNKIILLLHFPSLYKDEKPTGFSQLCDKYKVWHCIYAHLHDKSISLGFQGIFNNTNYHLVSADSLDFSVKKIL